MIDSHTRFISLRVFLSLENGEKMTRDRPSVFSRPPLRSDMVYRRQGKQEDDDDIRACACLEKSFEKRLRCVFSRTKRAGERACCFDAFPYDFFAARNALKGGERERERG